MLAVACGGGGSIRGVADAASGAFTVSGKVVKGPVAGGTVTAYRLDGALERGGALATATTDTTGAFSLTLPPYSGHVLLVASSGFYTEEASGTAAKLDGTEMVALVHDYTPGAPVTQEVTPLSHLAFALTRFWVAEKHTLVGAAAEQAWAHLNAHFGGLDWRVVAPTDVTAVDGGLQMGDADRAGLLLAALSQEMVDISKAAVLTPGAGLTTVSVMASLADDLAADGTFDGLGTSGRLVLPSGALGADGGTETAFDSQTVRFFLAEALSQYLQGSENHTGLTVTDALPLMNALTGDSDKFLFPTPGSSSFDTTPPAVSVVSVSAEYTNQPSVALVVSADDGPSGSGVAQVYVQSGSQTVTGLAGPGHTYTFPSVPLGTGRNTLYVWAVDKANNSGAQAGAPFRTSAQVFFSSTPPAVAFEAFTPSYFDERQMQLTTSAGLPVVPAAFTFPPGAQKVPVGPDNDVYKTSATLSWGAAAPSGALLEGANPYNTPFLQVSVAFDPNVNAPIASMTYQVSTGVQGSPQHWIDTGNLIQSGTDVPGKVLYDLPLALESISAFGAVPSSPVTLAVTITAVDAAGNTTQYTQIPQIRAHVLGPPLGLQQDTNYPFENDGQSIYPYLIGNGTYGGLWSGSSPLARAARFLLYNPWPVPVAVTLDSPTAWTVNEEWDTVAWAPGATTGGYRGTSYSADGFSFLSGVTWFYYDTSGGNRTDYPCGTQGINSVTTLAWHQAGDTQHQYLCSSGPVPSTGAGPLASYRSGTSVLFSAQVAGNESVPASSYGNHYVVPAASGTTPGAVVIYAGRPHEGSHSPALVYQSLLNPDGQSRFYSWLSDYWDIIQGNNCSPVSPGVVCAAQFYVHRFADELTRANESYAPGTLSVTSFGAGPTPETDLGEPFSDAASTPWSASTTH